MTAFKEKQVFEYCEQLYRKFKNEDGGYYPSIHDNLVFIEASKEFEMPIKEIYRIYNAFTNLSAKIEILKINRLPKAKRAQARMKRLRGIILENHDLPFYKMEDINVDAADTVVNSGEIIEEEYKNMITNMAKLGWTIPLTIDLKEFQELEKSTDDDKKLDSFFETFYTDLAFTNMCSSISKIIANIGQKKRFEECIKMYRSKMYSSCITVLTTVLEGVISTFGDKPEDVRVMKICSYHANEEKMAGNNIQSLCWMSMLEYTKLLFKKSDFTKSEPDMINRHWISHGRTSKLGERIECLRLFNALSTMTNIKGIKSKTI